MLFIADERDPSLVSKGILVIEKLVPLFRLTGLLLINNLYVPWIGAEWLCVVEIQIEFPKRPVSVKGSTDLAIDVSLHRVILIEY